MTEAGRPSRQLPCDPDPDVTPRLRALIITPIYPWPGLPSEGTFVHRQVRLLTAMDVACHVVTFRPALRGLPRLLHGLTWLRCGWRAVGWPRTLDGVPVDDVLYHSPLQRGTDLVPRAAAAVRDHLRANPGLTDVDVVYAHWLWPGGAVGLALRESVPALARVPLVAIARGSDVHGWLDMHRHCRGHVERVLRRADLVLANCQALARRAQALVPAPHTSSVPVVHNGVDTTQFRPSATPLTVRRRLGLPDHGHLLLCCISVKRRKGAYELAAAWERVAPLMRDWTLVVIGAWVEPRAVARLQRAKTRTAGRVILTGAVPPAAVREYMQACDALVHPSHAEGIANATMEAMATALPVISTSVDGQTEIIEDGLTGRLIPPHDVAALADAILELARDPSAARARGTAARQHMMRRFESEVHTRRLAGLLSNVARSPSPARIDLSIAS